MHQWDNFFENPLTFGKDMEDRKVSQLLLGTRYKNTLLWLCASDGQIPGTIWFKSWLKCCIRWFGLGSKGLVLITLIWFEIFFNKSTLYLEFLIWKLSIGYLLWTQRVCLRELGLRFVAQINFCPKILNHSRFVIESFGIWVKIGFQKIRDLEKECFGICDLA